MVWLPVGFLVVLALVYSFLTIGDSPVLTTAITEVTEPGHLGFVLAVRSLARLRRRRARAARRRASSTTLPAAVGWPPAAVWGVTFGVLGLGGVIAAVCAARLGRRAA